MDKNSLKKNMLLKKESGKDSIQGSGDSERKGNSIGDTEQIFRVLAVERERVLVIDCIKKTMPVWMEIEKLDGFTEEEGSCRSGEADFDSLEDYSPDVRKIIYQRYNIISAILPFVADESMRSEMVARMAEEHGISKQSVRKYLCEYLSSQDIRSLAPQERNTDRALTQDDMDIFQIQLSCRNGSSPR